MHNIHQFFDHVIGIDYLASINVHPQFSSKADAIKYSMTISSSPGQYLYIGDTFTDMEAAQQAGCDFLAVGYGYTNWSKHHQLSPPYVSSVEALYKYLGF